MVKRGDGILKYFRDEGGRQVLVRIKRARGVGTGCGLEARFSGDHGKSVRCRGLAGAEIADWGR